MSDMKTSIENGFDNLINDTTNNGVKRYWKCVNPTEMSERQTFHYNRKKSRFNQLRKRLSENPNNTTLKLELDKCKENLINWTLESCPIRVREENEQLMEGEYQLQMITENELRLDIDDVKDTFKLITEETETVEG